MTPMLSTMNTPTPKTQEKNYTKKLNHLSPLVKELNSHRTQNNPYLEVACLKPKCFANGKQTLRSPSYSPIPLESSPPHDKPTQMKLGSRKILVTAALPYANGPIHLGHLVEYLQADFWVRFQKMRNHECHYFCAEDTHGTPIMIRAMEEGVLGEEIIAQSQKSHFEDFQDFSIEFTHFSSTHSKTNKELCWEIYKKLKSAGYLETRSISQAYCQIHSMFLPDRFVKGTCPNCGALNQYGDSCEVCGATYRPTDLLNPRSVLSDTPPTIKESEHVFFKLNLFKDFLKTWIPQHNCPEVAEKLKEWVYSELKDWDISRDKPYFGFEIPDMKDKYFYVWMDAPVGYISTTKEWCEKNNQNFLDFWGPNSRAEVHHFIGKDIIYFHSIFWPAVLKGSGFRTPSQVWAHGFLTVNGTKMSKSKGTFIKARTYLKHLDPSYLRYYYACKLTQGINDLDLNTEDFVQRVNSDLVGKFINIGSRASRILSTHFQNKYTSKYDSKGQILIRKVQGVAPLVAENYENRNFSKVLVQVRELAHEVNSYFSDKAPWKQVAEETGKKEAHGVLSASLEAFRILGIYLQPIVPDISQKTAHLFGRKNFLWKDISETLPEGFAIENFTPMISRIKPEDLQKVLDESQN